MENQFILDQAEVLPGSDFGLETTDYKCFKDTRGPSKLVGPNQFLELFPN